MKVLGVMGSPRVGGNSDILLDEALAGAKDAGGLGARRYPEKYLPLCERCRRFDDYPAGGYPCLADRSPGR